MKLLEALLSIFALAFPTPIPISTPPETTVMMMTTGDVMPARSVNYQMVKRNNFRWPFEKIADILSTADITVINLETPLLTHCPPTNQGMVFCGDARAVEGLVFSGVDVATLGNNHTGNYGKEGVDETQSILVNAGILPVLNKPVYTNVNGIRFAFISFNDIGSTDFDMSNITDAQKLADIVIVSFHWGNEYVREPTLRQRELAHQSIDAGADVVLGNHPHWIQPTEVYNGKFILYAHGNFVFDQEWSEETKLGVVGRFTFKENKLVDTEFLPIRIVDYGQPYFLEGDEAASVLKRLIAQ